MPTPTKPLNSNEALEQFQAQTDAARRAFVAIGEAMTLCMLQFTTQLGVVLRTLDAAIEKAYQAAGAPYGDTADGRYRWAHEQAAAYRVQEEERLARQREQDLADFGQLGAMLRARSLENGEKTNADEINADEINASNR